MLIKIFLLTFSTSLISALPNSISYDFIKFPDSHIVGGDVSNIEDYPFIASLQRSGRHACGCNILTNIYVLSAAHCTEYYPASMYQIRVGSSFHAQNGTLIDVAQIIQHPNYNPQRNDYDVSILKLKTVLEFGEAVSKIPILCNGQTPADNTPVVTLGWGNTKSNESNAQLRSVEVKIVSQKICEDAYRYMGLTITDRMICAGLYGEGGKDACQGDSGGPLSLTIDGKPILVGVVSFGSGCGKHDYPGVYARVSAVAEWIKSTTGLLSCERLISS